MRVRSAAQTEDRGSDPKVHPPFMPLPPLRAAPPSAGAPGAGSGASLRVLVVDDNVDVARTFSILIRRAGHEARTAHDGKQALATALDFRPHVVLLDIGLPRMDGHEVARHIRREPTLDGVVLVAMTGYGGEADRRESRRAGFDHHLVKPTTGEQLRQILTDTARAKGGQTGPSTE